MGKRYSELQADQISFIADQHLFFVATAPAQGRVNLSPKGMDALRVLSPTRILWLNLTGSGNETAPHVAADPRITLMWCGFEKRPLILRAYGTARVIHRDDADWPSLCGASARPARRTADFRCDDRPCAIVLRLCRALHGFCRRPPCSARLGNRKR
jgi:Pyridoxamine 5'-phosphate oxidase